MPNPSPTHQALVMWSLRKMQADGYIPLAYDGALPQFDCLRRLKRPPVTSGVRPDAFAFSISTGLVAFGEAKTRCDLQSEHTKYQLSSYATLKRQNPENFGHLYLAVPRSASRLLDRLLVEVGLCGNRNVRRMHVPDCLVEEDAISYA